MNSQWLTKYFIAHRGFHDDISPENSLSAFQKAINKNYTIELDVHLLSDGEIAVFHDESLKRMTGQNGKIEDLKTSDLKKYKLNGTNETIPTLKQVLNLVNDKVPLLIEIKNIGKVGNLESSLFEILKNYKGRYAIQSFNPFSLSWFKKHAPQVLRGQLSGFLSDTQMSYLRKIILKKMLLNKFISKPNFISYDARNIPNKYVSKYKKLPLLVWTIRSQQDYEKLKPYCDNIIFENFEPKN